MRYNKFLSNRRNKSSISQGRTLLAAKQSTKHSNSLTIADNTTQSQP